MNDAPWGILVVIYLFFAGLGAGSFCLGAMARRRRGQGWEACARTAFRLAPIAILIGLLILIFDLGYKARFWMTLTVLNIASPMSVGVWLLSAFFIVSAYTAVFLDKGKWLNGIIAIGVPLALGVSVYTGVLLSASVPPLWRNPAIPFLFFISALSLGIEGGAILGLISLKRENRGAMEKPLRWLKRNYQIILPLYLFVALLFVGSLAIAPSSRREAFGFMTGWCGLIWWIGVVGIGILVPWVLVLKRDKRTVVFPWFFSSCLIAGDFLLRLVLIFAGQRAL